MSTATPTAADVRTYQAAVRRDPVGWIQRALGVRLWSAQRAIARSVRDHSMVAVRSGHGIGKTYLASALAIWWLEAHCPSYAITTSSSWPNVIHGLWPTIRRLLRNAPANLGGVPLATEWKRGDGWGAFGVSTRDPENISGFRTDYGNLIIVDEASAIEQEIMEAILGLMAAPGARLLMIGNPLRPEGAFYQAFTDPVSRYATHHVSTLESPNVLAGRVVVKGLATRKWVEDRRADWGEGSPMYRARVLGEFPESAENAVVPMHWAEAALEREPYADAAGLPSLGVDVARFGDDRTCLALRHGENVLSIEEHHGLSTMETAGLVIARMRENGVSAAQVFVDVIGIGAGVVDRLKEQGYAVQGVNFGAAAENASLYANVRAECYWRLREALDPSNARALSIASKPLAYELCVARLQYTSSGKIQIEPKDGIKARLGRSPDLADALALTYAKRGPTWWVA